MKLHMQDSDYVATIQEHRRIQNAFDRKKNFNKFLSKQSCQESTIVSGEKYSLFKIAKTKNPAQEVHLATSKTGK